MIELSIFLFFFLIKCEKKEKIRTIIIHHVMIVNHYRWYFIYEWQQNIPKNIMTKSHAFTSIHLHYTFFVVTRIVYKLRKKVKRINFFFIFFITFILNSGPWCGHKFRHGSGVTPSPKAQNLTLSILIFKVVCEIQIKIHI